MITEMGSRCKVFVVNIACLLNFRTVDIQIT